MSNPQAATAAAPLRYGGTQDRHRLYIQNLQRKKQMEKEAEAARNADNFKDAEKERGFQCFFNGANRDLGLPCKLQQQQQQLQQLNPMRVNSKGLLRVAGALPVPTPMEHRDAAAAERRDWRPPPSMPPPRTAGRRRSDVSEPQERRIRRQWDLGRAVLVRAEDGEMLQLDVPTWGTPQLLAVS